MLGGMVIAQGKVLYRDYVTQHMPLGYYLCAAFAFLGAKSVEQFRLMYYLTVSLIWGAVYYRYGGRIGRRRIAALAVAETVLVSALYAPNATMILADNIHGLLLVVLLLEFMLYYSDRDLGWSRSAVVSLCIWGCIGSAFISVYSIVWVALAVVFIELREGFKTKRTIGEAFKRYYRFHTLKLYMRQSTAKLEEKSFWFSLSLHNPLLLCQCKIIFSFNSPNGKNPNTLIQE